MSLTEEIQEALKSGRIIIGYKESVKFIKLNKPKLIVIADNAPQKIRKEVEYLAKVAGARVESVSNSMELGIICGKPFPVTTLVIKG